MCVCVCGKITKKKKRNGYCTVESEGIGEIGINLGMKGKYLICGGIGSFFISPFFSVRVKSLLGLRKL